jgi:hypothetical protein
MSSGTDQRIPSRDPSQLPPCTETRKYVLSSRVQGSFLQFFFSSTPPAPDPSEDPPLQIRVPDNCQIEVELDSSLQWQFRTDGDAITLGSSARAFYFNLTVVNPQCVSFYALYNTSGDYTNNLDPYNIYVDISQGGATQPLEIRIDPDIENPGDHH